MKPSTALAALAPLLPLASARVNGFAVPTSIKPGSTFDVTITTENYIQSVEDVAMSFGYAPENEAGPDQLGTAFLSSRFIGPDESNITSNITASVTFPEDAFYEPIVFKGALFSLLGARYGPSVGTFEVAVDVSDHTSTEYKRSSPVS